MKLRLIAILFTLLPLALFAAKQPERKDIRAGNKEYKKQAYSEAELSYRRAMEKAPESANAKYNLGSALYKQVDSAMPPEEAKQQLEQVHKLLESAAETYTDDRQKAAAHYNEGNAYLREQNWQAAIDAYKKSLRLNPDDMEAKQNLVFAQAMNNQQQQNQKKDEEKKDDKNKDKEKKDEKNKDEEKKDEEKKDEEKKDEKNKDEEKKDKNNQQDQNQNKEKNEQQQGQQQQKISKEDAQRMLQALEQQEKDTQEKVKREKAQREQQRSAGKNW